MSGRSEKERMRDALLLTEGNLSSLIGVRYDNGQTGDNSVMVAAMERWRSVVRRALSNWSWQDECICPKCGLRHGGKSQRDPGF